MSTRRAFGAASTLDYDVAVKTIIVGDSGVGKSSLLYRYSDNDWNPHYIATIGVDFKVLTFERQNMVVKLQLWDTAGQERFRTITHSYYRGAHSVMMVFDITNHESFDNVATWMQDVKKFGASNLPLLLVGNKADCEAKREVSKEEANALALSLGCKYIETSAKDSSSVEQAFDYLTDECIELKKKATVSVPNRPQAIPIRRDDRRGEKTKNCPCS